MGLPLASFNLYLTWGCSAASCCRHLAFHLAWPAAKPQLLLSSRQYLLLEVPHTLHRPGGAPLLFPVWLRQVSGRWREAAPLTRQLPCLTSWRKVRQRQQPAAEQSQVR